MIPTPAAARRAAEFAVGDVKLLHGRVREHLSGSEIGAVVDAVLDAVQPCIENDVPDCQRMAIELDAKMQVRLAFRQAISGLPEIAPRDVAFVLSGVGFRDAFIREGKRLQREHGTTAVSPRLEQECGAGAWSFMRNGLRAGLDTTPGEALVDKLDRFKRVLAMHDALPEDLRPDDDAPLRAILPGVWPKVRHLRELVSVLEGNAEQASEETVTIYKTAAVGPTCAEMSSLIPADAGARSVVTTSFLHRLIENTFSWAMRGCNYLNPAHMDSLIDETRNGMKPEQAATWLHRDEKTDGNENGLTAVATLMLQQSDDAVAFAARRAALVRRLVDALRRARYEIKRFSHIESATSASFIEDYNARMEDIDAAIEAGDAALKISEGSFHG